MVSINPHDELRQWLDRTGRRHTQVAIALGISKAHLSNLQSGLRQPSLPLAKRIAELTGIPVSSWGATTKAAV
jgi:transcriptional regulator with XRE-family HTH domain